MPVLFIGHGSPMNAIEDNAWSSAWRIVAAALPRPRAVLCISPHWETEGPRLTGSDAPPTLHDFGGFPQALFDARYPAPGDPALAREVAALVGEGAALDPARGLDHGAWSVLLQMFPDAGVPVVQLGLDTRRDGAWHYALARRLNPLRDDGVLILASGNIVHNLRLHDMRAIAAHAWAVRFNQTVKTLIEQGQHRALMDFPALPDARNAVPTPEHFLPLLYALANGRPGERVTLFNEDVRGAIDMTSVMIDTP